MKKSIDNVIMNAIGILFIVFGVMVVVLIFFIFRETRKESRTKKKPRSSSREEFIEISKKISKTFASLIEQIEELEFFNLALSKDNMRFSIPKDHKYSVFEKIKISKIFPNRLKIQATLRKTFPSQLVVVKYDLSSLTNLSKFNIKDLKDIYSLYSDDPSFWTPILEGPYIIKEFHKICNSMNYFYISYNNIEGILKEKTDFVHFINLIQTIQYTILSIFSELDDAVIDELLCYSCGNLFDPMEEYCEDCGASRPICIVCFQKLEPSERDIVKLVCCSIYAHKNHLFQWLKSNPKCPNCRKNIKKWFDDFLTMEDIKEYSI